MRKHSSTLKKKAANSTTLRVPKLSKKELARRQALKDWYFAIGADAQIREMERGQAGSYDSQVLHDWALWYVDAVQPYVDAPDWGGVITV